MINLYEETLQKLRDHNKTFDNVIAIANSYNNYNATKEEIKKYSYVYDKEAFIKASKLINYDNGFGGDCVGMYLVIIGDDFYMDRTEYDGSIYWEYRTKPQIMTNNPKLVTMEDICKNLVGKVPCGVLTNDDIEFVKRYYYNELPDIDTLCVKKEEGERVLYVKMKKCSHQRSLIETLPISYTPPFWNRALIGEFKKLRLNKEYRLEDIMI